MFNTLTMRRTRKLLCCVVCAGIVISCILMAFPRSREYISHPSQLLTMSPRAIKARIFEATERNGTNQGVANLTKLCEIPRRMATYLEDLKRKGTSKRSENTKSIDENSDHEDLINEFSINRKMDSYPVNGTGKSVDNISEYFDPAIFNNFCDSPANLNAIVPVYSTADRFTHRHLLRNSLGRLATSLQCKLFFIIGVPSDTDVNELLQEEYAVEKDILMIDKIDTYRDLNNKAYAMLRWINKFCSHVPYVVHLVDDTYVNLQLMLKRLQTITVKYYIYTRKADTKTVRTSWPRSFVTVDEYIYNRFPPYAYGMVYAFPTVVAEKLLSVAHSATYCWIEDVWIGGHVRIAANVPMILFQRGDWIGRIPRMTKKKIPPARLAMHPVNVEALCGWYNRAIDRQAVLQSNISTGTHP